MARDSHTGPALCFPRAKVQVAAEVSPTPNLREQLQTTLGDSYTVERELSGGGMSRIFVARERGLGREVVVKVLPPDMVADVSAARFEREIKLAARLQHPHIVPVLSSGESAGLPYFVMPFIAGESLRDRLQRSGPLPVPETVRVLRDVATALDYAHSHGIVHRDIKPENILLTGGTAVVTDFGVAKAIEAASQGDVRVTHTLTSRGVALGTPAYMAPEQVAADPATDHRADIYAWGMVGYEMLSGAAPFAGRTMQAQFAAQIAEQVPPLERCRENVPPELCALVMRTLSKLPADRPQSAADLIQTLDVVRTVSVTSASRAPAIGGRRTRMRTVWAGAGALVLLLVAAWATGWFTRDRAGAGSGSVKTIAVLPFVNATGEGDDGYFAEGMSDEVSAALGRLPGVQVASRTSTFAVAGRNVNVRDIGKRLSVDAVLEGRVRRSGNRLRLTAQLTDATNGLSLWTDSYEREMKDLFAVQNDIARAIASALQIRLQPSAASAGAEVSHGTSDLVAYDLYLRGRYHWHRRGADNLRQAIRFFEQATERDKNFGRAYAGLAIATVLLGEYTDDVPAGIDRLAESAASRALAIDSSLAEAHVAQGLAHVHAWEWDEAENAYRRALAADPRYPTAHQWLGELLYKTNRVEESLRELRTATDLDPMAPVPYAALAYGLLVAERFDESVAACTRGLELAPGLGILYRICSFAHLFAGRGDEAFRQAQRALELEPEVLIRRGEFVYIAGKTGRSELARQRFAELTRTAGRRSDAALAVAYLGVGDRNGALTALERAIAQHDPIVSDYVLNADRTWVEVRDDPRFRRLLERMDLARFF